MADYDVCTIARLWSKIDRRGPSECWEWTGAVGSGRHGRVKIGGKLMLPHRVVYETEVGPLPETDDYHGTVIRHACDNPRCCNPAHLVPGSQRENVEDMKSRGRLRVQLDPAVKEAIAASDLSLRKAAALFGVDKKTVQRIRANQD
jgi:hypothetical protein